MTTVLDPGADLISVQDASFLPKSGKQTFGLGHFFNSCAKRAERGLELSTLAVVDVSRRCAFTLAVVQTPPGKADTRKDKREEETRMDGIVNLMVTKCEMIQYRVFKKIMTAIDCSHVRL